MLPRHGGRPLNISAMKLLISVSDQIWGGKHQYMFQIARGLAAEGHSLTLCAEAQSVFMERAEEHGYTTYSVPSFADLDQTALAELSDYLETQQIDIVITTGRRDSLALYHSLGGVEREIGLVVFRHSAFPLPETDEYLGMLARADLVISTSRQQHQTQFQPLIESGILAAERIVELPSAIDLNVFQPQEPSQRILEELALPADAIVVGCVARLSWEKDHATLLRACAQLIRNRPNLFVVLVGEGEERPAITTLAAELGIAEHVRLLGFREDVADILSVCSMHVLASNCDETGPLVLKEAMAMGIPVIASRRGGMPEFVIHEQTGLLFESGDATELADRIRELITRPRFTAKLAQAARELIFVEADERRQMRHLSYLLDQISLRRLPPSHVLRDFAWKSCVRVRAEEFGGLLFVADTSQMLPLDPDQYARIERSIARRNVPALVATDDTETRALVADLYLAGSFERVV